MGSRLILITSIIVLIALILNIGKIASIIGRVIKTLMPAAIEITGCTTISVEGEYVLTTDIIDAQGTCIDIQANNVILDCQGHTIDGIGSGNGIYISRDHPTDTNITIKNCIITDWVNGIYFDNANNNTLSNITANYNDVFGIYISTSNNNTLSNITANNNNYDGIRLLESNYNVITNITASNNTYVGIRLAWSSNNILSDIIANYNKERGINLDFGGNENNTLTNLTLISNYFGILFYNSTYNRIVNATISLSSSDAISLTENSNYNNITGSVIRDGTSVYGTGAIVVARSSYNLIEGNYLINNTIGVLLFSNATNNWVKNNTILNHTRTIPCGFSQSPCIDIPACGIIISNLSANNIISGNLIQGNGAEASETNPLQIAGGIMIGGATVLGGPAIGIYGSNDNLFYDNKLIGNIPAGVGIDDSSGNIFWNNILNNTLNINFAGPIYENYWNTTAQPGQRIYSPGYMIGGNYWTNPNGNGYSDICEDSDKDGFCDDPYILNNNNIDYLPLSDEYVYGDVTPPTYSNYGHNSTIAGQPVTFYILFNDNIALHPNGQWIFSTNNSGVWINDTPINFTTTPSWANVTKILNSTPGIVIGYRWYAKDNSGNINNTPIFTLTTTSTGWLSGWSYRKYINITEQSGNSLSDYQVLITLDTQTLISQGKMRSDCGDIRFTDSDGNTLLNYWLESGCNTANTRLWVKVPSIPASSTKKIYLYYGNATATSASNGNATFILFDDFDTGLGKWYNFGSPSPFTFQNADFHDGWGYDSGGDSVYASGSYSTLLINVSQGITIESRQKQPICSNDDRWAFLFVGLGSQQSGYREDTGGLVHFGYNIRGSNVHNTGTGNDIVYHSDYYDGGGGAFSEVNDQQFHRFTIKYDGGVKVEYYRDGVLKYTSTSIYNAPRTNDSLPIVLGGRSLSWHGECPNYLDYVLVRKFVSSEPTISVGAEERK